MTFSSILVPVDFSSHSKAALLLALGLVKKFDAKLHLVHVYPESMALLPPYGPALPADFGMQMERSAVEYFQEWQEKFCPKELSVHSVVRRGDPATQIVEVASDIESDLIVMGTRGTTGLAHLLLGSVAERTVRLAPCPVLTTKVLA
ncbi:MAG: universal stress protein A [Myxococcota bacterium]|jgi:universal stress protein A